MNQQELDGTLQRAAELKVFCEYGQRTIPVLDEIVAFVREISPAIEDLKAVVDVATVNIPKAAGQLERVTQATEQASTDILNTLDRMVATLDKLMSSVASGKISIDLGAAATKMAAVVKKLVEKSGWDEDVRELAETWESHLRSIKEAHPTSNLEGILKDLQSNCTEIMMSLQVQDITQQHIGAVMGTIEAVADGLRKLTSDFFNDGAVVGQPSNILPLHPDSDLVGETERKKMVESLLNKARAGEL
jgi:chemotaxis regulatin CheY-phosphate phosphatase CheZ